jgi:peptidoglycan/LPS O-acetylase OafA/YrhL
MSISYRPDIDGLRAISVLGVIFFHAGLYPFGGGFVGVDVFFVISGYLITRHINSELQSNSFSLRNFYERRARRILPALLFVIALTVPLAWAWLLPQDLKSFSQSVVATLIFASNLYFWRTTDYFSQQSEMRPMLHTWSLAVEEQFYLLFPLLLMLIARFFRRHATRTVLVLAIGSWIVTLLVAQSNPSLAFYFLHTRAWELLSGACAALLAAAYPARTSGSRIGGSCSSSARSSQSTADRVATKRCYLFPCSEPVCGSLTAISAPPPAECWPRSRWWPSASSATARTCGTSRFSR